MIDFNLNTDQQAIKAIARLQFHEDFKIYTQFLQNKIDALRKKNDHLSGDSLMWGQGHCQCLQKILDLPLVAREIIKKSD